MLSPDRPPVEVSSCPYAAPSQEWKSAEVSLENEEEQFAKILQRIADRVNETAEKAKDKPRRGFHAKIHAGVMGEFDMLLGCA